MINVDRAEKNPLFNKHNNHVQDKSYKWRKETIHIDVLHKIYRSINSDDLSIKYYKSLT